MVTKKATMKRKGGKLSETKKSKTMHATTKAVTQNAGTSPPNRVRMAFLIDRAKKLIDAGQVPERLQDLFPPDHLQAIAKSVGLNESSARELLAVAIAFDEAKNWRPGLGPSSKPSLVRHEVESIKSAAQGMIDLISSASFETRHSFTEISPLRHESDEIVGIEIGDNVLKNAVPSLEKIVDAAGKMDIPKGRPGSDKSAKYLALVYLKNVDTNALGSCTREKLTKLAHAVLEPLLPDDDETLWRHMITEVLKDGDTGVGGLGAGDTGGGLGGGDTGAGAGAGAGEGGAGGGESGVVVVAAEAEVEARGSEPKVNQYPHQIQE
jgi:hypothetical protein